MTTYAMTNLFTIDFHHELEGLPNGGGINMAHEAVDRHASGPLRDMLALRWLGTDGEVLDFTFDHLTFQIGLHERLGVDTPEKDYGKLVTVNEILHYLSAVKREGCRG